MDLYTAPRLVTDPLENWDDLTSVERSNIDLVFDDRDEFMKIFNRYDQSIMTAEQVIANEVVNRIIYNIVTLKRENEVKSIEELSLATRSGYKASFDNLIKHFRKSDERFFPINKVARTKNSYRQYKASLNHFIESEALKEKRNVPALMIAIRTIFEMPYLLPGVALNRKKPELTLARKYDRKNEISGLDHDWQDVIFKNATEKMKPVLAVLEATGCRPEELEKGVELRRDGDDIYIRIQNAKISGYRDLRVQTNTASSRYLLNYIDEQSVKSYPGYEKLNYSQRLRLDAHFKKNVITIQKDKTNLSQYFRDKRKYLGEEFKNLTPYYYRYQKATDLMKLVEKKQIDESVVQQALGHLDKKTKLNYIANNVDRAVSSRVTFARISK